jgi:quercetin dioxygenase-like cupin family protein
VAQPKPVVAEAPADAPAVSLEETLAAIQKALNELDEGAQACWARAATDRFDIEGQFVAQVTIGDANVGVKVVQDTVRNPVLATCMTTLLMAYRWAPPLHDQTIQLPFMFTAPDGQSVIDRRLVEAHTQGNISVAVLIDESNTGNGAASMFELHAPSTTGVRKADRAELWFFLTPGSIGSDQVAASDMAFVAAGALREIKGNAVRVTVPGGIEGTARAGALPTPLATGKQSYKVLRAASSKTYGPVQMFLEGKDAPMAASILSLPSGASVAEHVHAHETEMLYILEGAGTMTIAGQAVAVTPTSDIQIPPNTKHAFAVSANLRALQIYTPPGPEQRFKKPQGPTSLDRAVPPKGGAETK